MKIRTATAPPPEVEARSRPLLSVDVREQGTTRIVAIEGEMDISSVEDVRLAVDRALRARPETLLVDLSELAFCDSTGVHLVVQTHRRATTQDTRLLVVPPVGAARRVFDICCIGDHVTFVGGDVAANGP
jgi:anti-sigma B factor antagonist